MIGNSSRLHGPQTAAGDNQSKWRKNCRQTYVTTTVQSKYFILESFASENKFVAYVGSTE